MSSVLLPLEPDVDCLRFSNAVAKGRVDRSMGKYGGLRGFVVAQLGHFKSKGRGQFNEDSLARIVEIGNAVSGGLRSRFTHPSLSSDGLGSFLGRASNFFLDKTADGTPAVRADLRFAGAADKSPRGKLAQYVMHLAEEDPDALSSSLVVEEKQTLVLKDEHDVPIQDEPPVWLPTKLRATDIVDTGDAVDGLLSADEQSKLQDAGVRNATKMLDMLFAGQEAGAIRTRCVGFVDSYLANRFGEELSEEEEAEMAETQNQDTDARLSAMESQLGELKDLPGKFDKLSEMLLSEREQRQAEEAKSARVTAIQEKGALAHASAEQVTKWIADESLSVEDVKDAIIANKFERAKDLNTDSSGDTPPTETAEDLGKKQFAQRGKPDGPRVVNKELTAEDYALSAKIDAGEVGILDLVKE